ncbi:hypothetical protein HU200_009259 [Digitaria exilis]|uniref:Peptidase S59 domain-containing protein n=1 Tax=Digitaria exilis TaxID=1010633 RepID=A0A835FLA5_9POAL|nr:hypothetical protein HU200_009259 [Digitaria exilis]
MFSPLVCAFFIAAFGQSSTSPFGQTSFGTPQGFGQATPNANNPFAPKPFGSPTTTFGAQTGSSLFGNTSTGAFGQQQSTPTFGTTPTGAFGQQQSTPTFGTPSSSPFGSSTPAFGASPTPTPTFGATSSTFGSGQKPTFGSSPSQSSPFGSTFQQTQPAFGSSTFGASTTPAFGTTTTPAFGTTTTPAFGTTTPAFGTTTTPAFGAATTPGFGSTSTSIFGASSAPAFGSTPFGSSAPSFGTSGTTAFGSTGFGSSSTPGAFNFGSSSSFGQTAVSSGGSPFGTTPSPFGGQTPAFVTSPFPSSTPPNTFTTNNPFSQTTPNPFSSNNLFNKTASNSTGTSLFNTSFNNTSVASSSPFSSSTSTAMFGQTGVSAFAASSSPSLFANTTPAFASSSLFGTSTTNNSSPFGTGLSLGSTQSAPLFQSSPAFTQLPSSTPAFSSGNLFSTPTSTGGFPGFSNTATQAFIGQQTPSQSNMVMQPALVSNPFGTLPAMPQMSIGNGGSSPSVQYGISSLPVAEKPLPSRTLSMAVPRHLSQRRIKLLPRKYNPISDGKVPFFADDEEAPATPKADAFFIPRENPRNLIIRPIEQWPPRSGINKQSLLKDSADLEKYEDASTESGLDKTVKYLSSSPVVENGKQHKPSHHGNGKVTSVERLLPKLPEADYFTEPSLEELAAKERGEPGYCGRLKDFVVGRHGYGSIKFLGETDVRGLDLESIVEFNNREVIVYKDDSKKPPVGEGLNKAAEVTLLNIRCVNKKTGEQYDEGPRVERYREMLMKKAEEQGAEFVSFDAAKGEWKFRVKHFSAYGLW